jgi:hypothetical protein
MAGKVFDNTATVPGIDNVPETTLSWIDWNRSRKHERTRVVAKVDPIDIHIFFTGT